MESSSSFIPDGPGVPGGPWGLSNNNSPMMGQGMMHHIPQFLKSVSPEDAQSFIDIMKSKTMTKSEIQTAEDAWAANKNSTIQALYGEFKTNKTAKMNEMKNMVDQKISTLSTTAQKLVTDIESIISDTSITREDEHQKIKTLLDGASDTDKESIKNVLPHFGPKMDHGGMEPNGVTETGNLMGQK
ncbi:Domain of unknown function DUF148 domain-containing protein [Strongyloides ratti]|uniref:DUF148 domain-containing protein n=1 Tax=Strongyloides ratti TaxID=34506 RepID=A0A090LKH5_STRRB|nr:Domain of unknown function DUF148 domain-containing protein [Strongyloides ratti]CEF70307.1 Domain of unknown function DUF148 domain-containing protein [Strongyloides ratti]